MRAVHEGERTFTIDDLSEFCGQPVSIVTRWVDRGLLLPMRGSVCRFTFRSVGTVRTLAELWRAGWSAPRILRAWEVAQTVIEDPDAALSGLLASISELSGRYDLAVANVFHAGDGNLHPLILFDAKKKWSYPIYMQLHGWINCRSLEGQVVVR